jgi:hypothetical protein
MQQATANYCLLVVCVSCRGEVADAVVMDKKNYGFVTFADPKIAMKFLEVCAGPQQQQQQQQQE